MIGQFIGRYEIKEQVGEGGMATVYKALDTHLERDVAIKIIRKEVFSSDNLDRVMQRFEREGKALAKLCHPNIIRIYDHGVYNGSPYLVMEFIETGTLKAKMGKPIPWKDAVQIITPIAEALAYAHQRGIIHRDVKPANILINSQGQPILTDFGIAKLLEGEEGHTLTGLGVGIGTPEYMSPEQGQGLPIDERTDIYSLGIIFFEMVTGRKPFRADTPLALVYKHVNEPLPQMQQINPNIPNQVESLIRVALAKNPANRFANMKAMINALGSLSSIPSGNNSVQNYPQDVPLDLLTEQVTHDSFITLPTQDEQSPEKNKSKSHLSKGKSIWIWLGCIIGFLLIASAVLLSNKSLTGSSPDLSGSSIHSSSTQNSLPLTPLVPTSEAVIQNTVNAQPTATHHPTSVPTYFPLTNCGPSRLQVGDSVYVSMGGTHNDIRSEPDTHPSNNTLEEAYQGDVLQIIGGPECDASGSHWVMWEVHSSYGTVGWTPESDGSNFWLTPIETYQACSNNLPTRLRPGGQAQISNNGVASTLRQNPSTSAEIVEQIDPGTMIEILAGPTCSDGYVWFQIRVDQSNQEGWLVEGDATSYWIIPIINP